MATRNPQPADPDYYPRIHGPIGRLETPLSNLFCILTICSTILHQEALAKHTVSQS